MAVLVCMTLWVNLNFSANSGGIRLLEGQGQKNKLENSCTWLVTYPAGHPRSLFGSPKTTERLLLYHIN